MKKRRYLLIALAGIFFTALFFDSCQLGRYIFYNFADITDYKIFPSRELKNDSVKFTYATTTGKNVPATSHYGEKDLDHFLEKNKTVAFLIIRNDTLQYEKYFKGYDETSVIPSFSMAKSITSILVGCAIDDGLIKSVNDPVANYLPELKDNGFDKITIRHLLQMTSGIKFNESYVNPLGDAATYYYGRDLRKAVGKMKPGQDPGQAFDYISGNTQVLGMVLERVLGGKTITTYLEEKLWKPLGMEYDASWSLDRKKDGLEKTFCCLNARARDFAKIGRLFLNKGNWNGRQIVSKEWVEESTRVDSRDGSAWYYQYQWWLASKQGDYFAQGILGQFVYVNPAKNLVIVRMGSAYGNADWPGLFQELAAGY